MTQSYLFKDSAFHICGLIHFAYNKILWMIGAEKHPKWDQYTSMHIYALLPAQAKITHQAFLKNIPKTGPSL
jgi:hypothetical protein